MSGTNWITEKCVHTGCQRIPPKMTELIVWDCMGLSCIHWACYTDQREQFWSWNMVNHTTWNQKKDVWWRNYQLPSAKKMEALSSVKMTMENCLGTIHLFWISLTMVPLSADDCYCGTLRLRWPFFAKGLGYFARVLFFCIKMPGAIHPTGQLFMAVHLIGYGSVPILSLVFYLPLNPWEAPGRQVIAIGADVKQVMTSQLQTLDNSVFILEYKPSYQGGTNAEMVVVWCVPSVRSDVYHLWGLMCTICITYSMYWSKSHNSLTGECLLTYFLKVLCIYIAVWAGEFINSGCSEWWGFCVFCW